MNSLRSGKDDSENLNMSHVNIEHLMSLRTNHIGMKIIKYYRFMHDSSLFLKTMTDRMSKMSLFSSTINLSPLKETVIILKNKGLK